MMVLYKDSHKEYTAVNHHFLLLSLNKPSAIYSLATVNDRGGVWSFITLLYEV